MKIAGEECRMYSRSTRARAYRSGTERAGAASDRSRKKTHTRLLQLTVCLVLFLTVFVGKGVFPHKISQAKEQLLNLMGQNTDFSSAFARIGDALAKEDSLFGELGTFCIQVFGPSKEGAVSTLAPAQTGARMERQFLNSASGQTVSMAHYLRLEQLPEGWLNQPQEREQPQEKPAQEEQQEIPAVGTVLLRAEYQGPALPDGYTMDQLSLGALEIKTPVFGTLRSAYGYREHPIDGGEKFHNGVDIGAAQGADIGAFAAGTVEYIGESDAYGKYLQIDHGQGIKSFYAHCSALNVSQGQVVAAGECVAQVGATGNATGPHLHFELKCNGLHIDPAYYIQYKTP